LTLEAAADLSGIQYHLVRLSAANKTNLASEAVNSSIVGVLVNKPKSGEFATIGYFGEGKVVAGGALTVGDVITTNGSGRAATVGSAKMAVGRVLEAAGADGDVVRCFFFPPVRWTGAA
jgi:hypothetical protein